VSGASVHVGLHGLEAASLHLAMMHKDGGVGVCIDGARTQLHWATVREFDAFVGRLVEMVHDARRQSEVTS
jgi:hypothetical protein